MNGYINPGLQIFIQKDIEDYELVLNCCNNIPFIKKGIDTDVNTLILALYLEFGSAKDVCDELHNKYLVGGYRQYRYDEITSILDNYNDTNESLTKSVRILRKRNCRE
jgi:hypothetical protein